LECGSGAAAFHNIIDHLKAAASAAPAVQTALQSALRALHICNLLKNEFRDRDYSNALDSRIKQKYKCIVHAHIIIYALYTCGAEIKR